MLSIIICSINNDFLNRIKKSIFNSVKVPYEIIVFDNTDSKLPITKTYNLSALKARYDNLVFVHEDVEFLNYGWDKNIIRILQDLRVGIVGIAGSTYLPSVPSGWYLLQLSLIKLKFYIIVKGMWIKPILIQYSITKNNIWILIIKNVIMKLNMCNYLNFTNSFVAIMISMIVKKKYVHLLS